MNQVPIVVGGTSYWIQHLLFPNRLANKDVNSTPRAATSGYPMSTSLLHSISQLTPSLSNLWTALPESPPNAVTHPEDALSLHELLQALDPPVASRWHWRDTRKVLRSLQIMKETGRTPSEIISEQSESALIPRCVALASFQFEQYEIAFAHRYRTLCFWLYAQPSALNPRLDERIDDMIKVRKFCSLALSSDPLSFMKQGLLNEIRSLQMTVSSSQVAANNSSVDVEDGPSPSATELDYTVGIYQCIGTRNLSVRAYVIFADRVQGILRISLIQWLSRSLQQGGGTYETVDSQICQTSSHVAAK